MEVLDYQFSVKEMGHIITCKDFLGNFYKGIIKLVDEEECVIVSNSAEVKEK